MMQYRPPLFSFARASSHVPSTRSTSTRRVRFLAVGAEIPRLERLGDIQAENDHASPGLHGRHAELSKLLRLPRRKQGLLQCDRQELLPIDAVQVSDRVDLIEGQPFRQARHERVGQPLAVRVRNKHGISRNLEEAVHAQPDRQRHGRSECPPEVRTELILEQVLFDKQHLCDRCRQETLDEEYYRRCQQHQPQNLRRQSDVGIQRQPQHGGLRADPVVDDNRIDDEHRGTDDPEEVEPPLLDVVDVSAVHAFEWD